MEKIAILVCLLLIRKCYLSGMMITFKKKKKGTLFEVKIDISKTASNHYSLTDSFYSKSKKKGPTKSFRDIKYTDLMINASVCEQANANMSKDR